MKRLGLVLIAVALVLGSGGSALAAPPRAVVSPASAPPPARLPSTATPAPTAPPTMTPSATATATPTMTSTPAQAATPTVDQRPATPSRAAYVVDTATAMSAVAVGIGTWDRFLASPIIFSDDWNGAAAGLLDILGGSASLFVAPPPGPNAFGPFDAKLIGGLLTLSNQTVPAFRTAIATKKQSTVDAVLPAWNAFTASWPGLENELYGLPTYGPGGPVTFTVAGTLTLIDASGGFSTSRRCSGSGGYDDLAVGAGFVVRDERDTIIATGSIIGSIGTSDSTCRFRFLAVDVPEAAFYSFTIGHRTGPPYAFSDLMALHWSLALTIGS